MKLININVGIKLDNSLRIAEYLKQENPDIITVQEVTRHFEESVYPQFRSKEEIEKVLGLEYPHKFFGPLWITDATYKNGIVHRDFGGDIEQGSEIISKIPITSATNEHFYKYYSLEWDWTNWETEDCGRSVIVSELKDYNGKPFQLLTLHGIWTRDKLGDQRTIDECLYVINAAKRKNLPTIIAGDFNLLPDTSSIELMNKEFRNLITEFGITSTRPDFKDDVDEGSNVVDYIFVSEGIKVNSFEVPQTDISDHLPLILEFEVS